MADVVIPVVPKPSRNRTRRSSESFSVSEATVRWCGRASFSMGQRGYAPASGAPRSGDDGKRARSRPGYGDETLASRRSRTRSILSFPQKSSSSTR